MKIILSILLLTALFLSSCVSDKTIEEPQNQAESVEQAPASIEPEPEEPAETETAVEETPSEVDDNYTVSQELYKQTFDEIEALIKELNQVISRKQYDRWLDYLSNGYTRKYNSSELLNEINQYPQLKDNGIVLKNLKDYFDWVVVPSRSRAVLGEIVFVGENQVVAYSTFEGKKAKLYELERINDKWKISVWD